MNSENKTKLAAILNLDVLVSFVMLIGMLIYFRSSILEHIVGSGAIGIESNAYFMAAMTVISLLILFICSIRNENKLFIWLAVLFVLSAFASTALSGIYPTDRLPFKFISIFYWVAVMLISYYAVLHLNTAKFHVAIVVLAIPFLSYSFYSMRSSASMYSGFLLLNPVYFISYLMPVVLLLRSKVLKVGILLLIFVVVILSYKRLAILAYSTSILVYFYYLSRSGSNAKFWKIITVFLGSVMFIAVMAFSFRYMGAAFGLDWSGRMSDMVSGGGSGRFDIWKGTIAALASQPSYWLFGHGYLATENTAFGWAHNDFIEILYDFGLLGLALYLMFIGKIIKTFIEMKKLRYMHLDAFAVSLVWFAWGTMFSMLVIKPFWFLSLAFFWGMTIADFENTKRQAYISEIEDSLYETQYNDDLVADQPHVR